MDRKATENETDYVKTCEVTEDYTNLTIQEIASTILYSAQATMEMKVIIPIIFIIGVLGNVAFFLLLARVETMRTITNFYLANLAAADLMILILETMYQLWSYRSSIVLWNNPFNSSFGCISFIFGYNLFYCASTLLITIVSIDRYIAICRPLKYLYMKLNKKKTYILTALIWIISVLFSALNIPHFVRVVHVCIIWPADRNYVNFPNTGRYCGSLNPFMEKVAGFNQFFPLFLALITTTVFNIKIIQKLRQPPQNGNFNQMKRRITWMLKANSIVFFACLVPSKLALLQIYVFPNSSSLSPSKFGNFLRIGLIMAMVNSAINPVLYGLASPSYRRGFLKAFGFTRGQIEPGED